MYESRPNLGVLRGIYAITDPDLISDSNLEHAVTNALDAGVKVLQYRNKKASRKLKLKQSSLLKGLCDEYGALLIVNDDLDICIESQAHGLHLGRGDGDIEKARSQLSPSQVLGVTCHDDIEYAQKCHKLGVDYFAFGRLFPSQTKPNAPPCSLEILRSAVKLGLTCVGIGGINQGNIHQVKNTGAQMAAVIHSIFGHHNIKSQVEALNQKFVIQE